MADLSLTTDAPDSRWFAERDLRARLTGALNSTTHAERWKYTRPEKVLQLLPAAVQKPRISTPDGVSVETLTVESDLPADFETDLFNANTAPEACALLAHHGCMIHVTIASTPAMAITIEHADSSIPVVITCKPGVQAAIVETTVAIAAQQQAVWIRLGANSRLEHSRNSFVQTPHWQYLQVDLQRDACYELHNHSGGSELRRQDMQINHLAPGTSSTLLSAGVNHEKFQLDQQLTVNHLAPQTSSRQVFHNIGLDSARTTFNGRIHIAANCPGVDAQLTNKNLSLGDQTVFNTKPELEIYTDDVKCSHGATVGQIDAQQLFYFESRGIPAATAFKMLADAFLRVCVTGPLADPANTYFASVTGA